MAAPTENLLSIRLLLGVVIGLGLLLLLGLGLVIAAIILRLGAPQPPAPSAILSLEKSLDLPPGLTVKAIATESRYAIIHLAPDNGASGEWLLWLDAQGRARARINLSAQPGRSREQP